MARTPYNKYITLNGHQFHYLDWGGKQQPVILLHGLASTSRIWDFVAPLLDNSLKVLALDQRGHGMSDRPDHGYDFNSISRDLHRFVEQLELEKPIIVGHSWGGSVALEYAVLYPDSPLGLCFVDGGTIDISSRPNNTLEKARRDMAPPDFSNINIDSLIAKSQERFKTINPDETWNDTLLSNFDISDDGSVRARLSRENHMMIIEALWHHKPENLYSSVRCPVLLLPARRNESEESMVERQRYRYLSVSTAVSLLPFNKLIWFENTLHDVPLQKPRALAKIINSHIDNAYFREI